MIINKEKNFISVVVYVHNNEDNIINFLEKINNKLDENFENYEIICVNDKSSDNSVQEIKKFFNKFPENTASIVNMSCYQGIELSMNAGVDAAIGDFVYEFDNIYIDYDLDIIIKIYKEALKEYDIVSAISDSKSKLSSRIFYKVFNNNSNNMYQIHTETFRILSRRAINRIRSINKTIPYRKVAYANCGLKITSVNYKSIKKIKKQKKKKKKKKKRTELAIESIILFTDISYKLAKFMSFIMIFTTMLTGIYTVSIFLMAKPIEGWTTTMLLLSFAFFGIFVILMIMLKYLSILIDLIFKKEKYLIESIYKINK